MRKTNSFKLAVVAVGMLAIGTVSAQTTDLDVTAVDNKGTIKTLKVGNGITSELTPDNTTTYSIGGTLTAPTTINTDPANYFGLLGLEQVDITSGELPLVTPATATALSLPPSSTTNGLTLMVVDEVTGEIKKLLAEDAAKFLTMFNPAKLSAQAVVTGLSGTGVDVTVPNLVAADVAANPGKLFVYRNGVKLLASDIDATVDGKVTINGGVTLYTADVIEVQFTN
ncbi:hypothetical protein [Tenacibaculum piscium]|uniref:hypothetical protein n=1 Tax=Tenacibaculum piscium TaxID=1458515 RepID=UPI00187BB5DC|nr:hypothetical protein [Tenacibaculum piscium]MBE7691118.1 hypothetical protein [Tenacibaculum piscium]